MPPINPPPSLLANSSTNLRRIKIIGYNRIRDVEKFEKSQQHRKGYRGLKSDFWRGAPVSQNGVTLRVAFIGTREKLSFIRRIKRGTVSPHFGTSTAPQVRVEKRVS